jgi:hypothetical protein
MAQAAEPALATGPEIAGQGGGDRRRDGAESHCPIPEKTATNSDPLADSQCDI